jgi:hypothetical protein
VPLLLPLVVPLEPVARAQQAVEHTQVACLLLLEVPFAVGDARAAPTPLPVQAPELQQQRDCYERAKS